LWPFLFGIDAKTGNQTAPTREPAATLLYGSGLDGMEGVGGEEALRNGWEAVEILQLWRLLENVQMQGARNPEERGVQKSTSQ